MTVSQMSTIGAPPFAATAIGEASGSNAPGFEETLRGAIGQVEQLGETAQQKVTELLGGNGQDIHSAALAVEQANLSFELMLQVRNKIVSAYQEISRLQF